MKELDKNELEDVNGGISCITRAFYWAVGYMGTEVAWGAETAGTALPFVASK